MKRFLFLLLIFLSSTIALGKGTATFLAKGSGLALDIEGTGGVVSGDVKKAGDELSGVFTVDLRSFKTGIDLRDEHFCKELECTKFPEAKLTLKPVKLSAADGAFEGDLWLHGQSKHVSGTAKVSGGKVAAKFTVKLSEFGIGPIEYKVAKVKNEVEVKVELPL